MNEKDFKVQSYGFGELAQLYSPNSTSKSASSKFHRWIKLNKKLQRELIELGFYPGIRDLSPKMVKLIVEAVGEP